MPPATETDFEELQRSMIDNDILRTRGSEGRLQAVIDRFPSVADQNRFHRWASLIHIHDLFASPEKKTTAQDIIDTVSSTNFLNDNEVEKLVRILGRCNRPSFWIGQDENGVMYRVLPDAFQLRAHLDPAGTHRHQVVLPNILGVNANRPPKYPDLKGERWKGDQVLPDESNLSDDSSYSLINDSNDTNGFCFHQLGVIEAFGYHKKYFANSRSQLKYLDDAMASDDGKDEDWEPTGHVVVVRIDPETSKPSGVYAVFNMFPYYRDDQRSWVNKARTMPHKSPRFTLAKIADNIAELRWEKTIIWAELHDKPVEVVRVYKGGDPPVLLRAVKPETRED